MKEKMFDNGEGVKTMHGKDHVSRSPLTSQAMIILLLSVLSIVSVFSAFWSVEIVLRVGIKSIFPSRGRATDQ